MTDQQEQDGERDFDSTLPPLADAEGTIEHGDRLHEVEAQPYPEGEREDPGDLTDEDMGDEEEVTI